MEQSEIIEGNKLIAEFMNFKETFVKKYEGGKYDFDIPNGFTLIKETETTIEGEWCEILMEQDMCMIEDLIFHSSWDWLMPVVEKIIKEYRTDYYNEYDMCQSDLFSVTIGSDGKYSSQGLSKNRNLSSGDNSSKFKLISIL